MAEAGQRDRDQAAKDTTGTADGEGEEVVHARSHNHAMRSVVQRKRAAAHGLQQQVVGCCTRWLDG